MTDNIRPTAEQRKKWAELAEKATPGPWGIEPIDRRLVTPRFGITHQRQDQGLPITREQALLNSEFMAESRTAVPALLREVERLEKLLEDKETSLRRATNAWAARKEGKSHE